MKNAVPSTPGDASAALNRPRKKARGKTMKKIAKHNMFSRSLYKKFFADNPSHNSKDFLMLLKEYGKFRPDDEIIPENKNV